MIVNDFTKNFDAKTFEDIFNQHLDGLDISILHNNVGIHSTGKFLDMSDDEVHNMITCNTYSSVLLTRFVAACMARRNKDKKKRSLIVFTSSMLALAPAPDNAVFAASKILNDFMTNGLEYELAQHNIDVCSWRPTEFTKSGWLACTPDHFVKCAYNKVTSGTHSGYFAHELLHCLLMCLKDFCTPAPALILSKLSPAAAKKGSSPKKTQ
jgi:short-subunit dehydrogenase